MARAQQRELLLILSWTSPVVSSGFVVDGGSLAQVSGLGTCLTGLPSTSLVPAGIWRSARLMAGTPSS